VVVHIVLSRDHDDALGAAEKRAVFWWVTDTRTREEKWGGTHGIVLLFL